MAFYSKNKFAGNISKLNTLLKNNLKFSILCEINIPKRDPKTVPHIP